MELTNGLLFFGISLWECHFSGRPSQALQLSELLDRKLGFCPAYILYNGPKDVKTLFFCICRFESHFLELVRRHLTANYASDMTNRHFFTGMNGNSRSRPSPGKSFPNFGKGFFHSLPVPEFWEGVSFIPYPILNIFLLLQFWLF